MALPYETAPPQRLHRERSSISGLRAVLWKRSLIPSEGARRGHRTSNTSCCLGSASSQAAGHKPDQPRPNPDYAFAQSTVSIIHSWPLRVQGQESLVVELSRLGRPVLSSACLGPRPPPCSTCSLASTDSLLDRSITTIKIHHQARPSAASLPPNHTQRLDREQKRAHSSGAHQSRKVPHHRPAQPPQPPHHHPLSLSPSP